MCGIAGLIAPGLTTEERETWMHRMLARLAHRGPDGEALWSGEGATLGIARLAIVGTAQPACVVANERGTIHAVVNGEIYNYRERFRALEARGHRIDSALDTAVVVHEYEEHGTDFPLALDGMFAVALWDAEARLLVLARDRAGEKPLFVSRASDRIAFASEPAALLALPWVSRSPAPGALARYLTHGFFGGADTAFAALSQLPPGGSRELAEGLDRSRRYWRPWDALGTPAPQESEADALARTREALDQAVASRIPAEVPFGILLSGGVDSSLVAALAARHTKGFPTFSLKMEAAGYDESGYARQVAERLGTEHHEVAMGEAEGREALELFGAGMDQPLGDPSVLPTWAVARLASYHVPVVLTGEGGDELFAGYPTYLGHRYAAFAAALPGWANGALLGLARALRPRDRHISPMHAVERFLSVRGRPPFERHLAWFGACDPREALGFLAPGLRAGLAPTEPLAHVESLALDLAAAGLTPDGQPSLTAYQILDLSLYLGGGLVTKVDRCAMAHSVESRAPFLRKALIEMALALPDALKLRGNEHKWVLKEIAVELLPEKAIRRRKQGFSPPFSAWARGPMRRAVRETLSRSSIARAGVLDASAVEAVMERHLAGEAEHGRLLWTLLSLQLWAERHAGTRPAAAPGGATSVPEPSAEPGSGAPGPGHPTTG